MARLSLAANPSTPSLLFALLLSLGLVLPSQDAASQYRRGNVGLGGQIGEPSGVTLKLYRRPGFAYDFLAAWDFDEYFELNVHGLYEQPLEDSPLRYYLGPGAFIRVYDRPRREDEDVFLGVSATGGVNFFIEQFEVFLQLTPRIYLVPGTDVDLGGGVGLRYYFQ